MASIIEKCGKFSVEIRKKGFKPVYKTCDSRKDAEKWASDTEAAMVNHSFVDNTIAQRTTLGEALLRYKCDIIANKEHKQPEISRINMWLKSDLKYKIITTLRGADFAEHRDKRIGAGRANNTVRLELQLVSHLYNVARKEWKGFEGIKNPLDEIKKPGGSNSRTRRLEAVSDDHNEYDLIFEELSKSRNIYAKIAFVLAVETSARKGLLFKIRWRWIDLMDGMITVPPEIAGAHKNKGVPLVIPLTPVAILELMTLQQKLIVDGKYKLDGFVIDTTVSALNNIWRKRIRAKGIASGFRWHDLRHEATSRFFEMGLEIMEVSSITGHKNLAMLKRYTHLRAQPLVAKLAAAQNQL